MARRKNTAEAFEILLQIAEEEKRKSLAAASAGPQGGGSSDRSSIGGSSINGSAIESKGTNPAGLLPVQRAPQKAAPQSWAQQKPRQKAWQEPLLGSPHRSSGQRSSEQRPSRLYEVKGGRVLPPALDSASSLHSTSFASPQNPGREATPGEEKKEANPGEGRRKRPQLKRWLALPLPSSEASEACEASEDSPSGESPGKAGTGRQRGERARKGSPTDRKSHQAGNLPEDFTEAFVREEAFVQEEEREALLAAVEAPAFPPGAGPLPPGEEGDDPLFRPSVDPELRRRPARPVPVRIDMLEAREPLPRRRELPDPDFVSDPPGCSDDPGSEDPSLVYAERASSEPAECERSHAARNQGDGTPPPPFPGEMGSGALPFPPCSPRGDRPGDPPVDDPRAGASRGLPPSNSPSNSPGNSTANLGPRAHSSEPEMGARQMLSKLVEQGAKRFMVWALGERGASFFSRRLEVRLSSLLILAMAAVIFMMLILSYWKSPEPGDPYFNRRWAAEGDSEPLERSPSQSGSRGGNGVDSSGTSGSASLTTEGTVVSKGTVVPKGTVIPKNTVVPKGTVELKGLARPLPLWGPSSTDVAGGARPDRRGPSLTAPSEGRRDPELRNVAAPPPTPFEDSLAPSAPAAASTPAAQDPASPYIYLIQVRAKESMEGAQRILEYLSANFGLGPAYIERDLRGDHNAEGKVLYTAFVGPYFRRVEADKECERLKKETRRTPYRNREDFFQDCLVITRTR